MNIRALFWTIWYLMFSFICFWQNHGLEPLGVMWAIVAGLFFKDLADGRR